MPVSLGSIENICHDLRQKVSAAYTGLGLHFIAHRAGKMSEAMALAEHDVIVHPAGQAAIAMMRRRPNHERSALMGLAIAQEKGFLGFRKTDHLLAVFHINADEFDSEASLKAQLYHLVWHAIDLYEIRSQPQYKNKFKSGPMVPKRSALNLAKAHLQADVFAATYAALQKDSDMLEIVMQRRALDSLIAIPHIKAEDYPTVVALDACRYGIEDLCSAAQDKSAPLILARKLSLEIGHTFDETSIQHWWDFSIPAQDMAWRGFSKEQILGAAVNVSANPYVRSVGYMVQELSRIEPAPAHTLDHVYNAFMDPEVNMRLHREMVDTIFEEAIARGAKDSGARALRDIANKQNEDLTEGRFIGWCAAALQGAAKAFERALISGSSPTQAARMHFEGSRDDTDWETLKTLGQRIVDQKRQGFAVTMGHIAEICHNNPAFAPVLDSLKVTMNDPAYIQKLEASNDLVFGANAPAPQAPAPKGPAPQTPAPTAAPTAAPSLPPVAPSGPSLGGNNRAAQILRQRQIELQKQTEQNNQDGTVEE